MPPITPHWDRVRNWDTFIVAVTCLTQFVAIAYSGLIFFTAAHFVLWDPEHRQDTLVPWLIFMAIAHCFVFGSIVMEAGAIPTGGLAVNRYLALQVIKCILPAAFFISFLRSSFNGIAEDPAPFAVALIYTLIFLPSLIYAIILKVKSKRQLRDEESPLLEGAHSDQTSRGDETNPATG